MSSLSFPAQAALLRRARRLAVRSPLRSLWTGFLVFAAVAVGVSLMAGVWGHHVSTQSVEAGFGQADAVYAGSGLSPDAVAAASESLQRQLPPGSTTAVEAVSDSGFVVVNAKSTGSGAADGSVPASVSEAHMADWSNPLLRGVVRLVDGRLPADGEAVVTADVADKAGLVIGDRMQLLGSDGTLRVVGIGRIGNVGAPGFATTPGSMRPAPGGAKASWLNARLYAAVPAGTKVPTLDSATDVDGFTFAVGAPAVRDAALASPGAFVGVPGTSVPLWSLIVFLVGTVAVVGLLAGSAFGIGASRRMRATGLLSANGADRSQLAVAAATEAVVVTAPAALLAVGFVMVLQPLWVRFRLPGWASALDASFPLLWVAVTVVAAVVAAAVGAVLFSRAVRRMSSSALLDGRGVGRSANAPSRPPERLAWYGWLGIGVLAYLFMYGIFGFVALRSSTLAAGVVVVLWVACAFGAMRVLRLLLRRDPVGRLVERDLRRRRVGSTAAILVVATWVFVAVGASATDWFSSLGNGTSSPDVVSALEPGASTTVVSASPDGGAPGQPATPTTVVGSDPGPTSPVPTQSGAVLITPAVSDAVATGGGSAGWVIAGSEPVGPAGVPSTIPSTSNPLMGSVPDGIATELADAGLLTRRATIGKWTGECSVCPSGFVPNVLVLDSATGLGLPQATVDMLEQGAAVTPFNMEGVEAQTVAGVPVKVGEVPFSVQAVVLASSIVDGSKLTDMQGVLVGDSSTLTSEQTSSVRVIARDTGVTLDSRNPMLQQYMSGSTSGDGRPPYRQPDDWLVWPWLLFLVIVTLVTTAAHRREHTEAARVLRTIGADPSAGRRLASLTAGSLAGVGVGMGLTAVLVVIVISAARNGAVGSSAINFDFDRLWNRQATLVLVAALVVPFVVALLARLIRPYRSIGGPDGPMPA